MRRYVTVVSAAAAAGVVLSTVGVTGASASGAAAQTQQAVRGPAAGRGHAAVSPGTQLWAKHYNSGGLVASVAASPTGNLVFATGAVINAAGTAWDYGTVAYNAATGAQLWAKRYLSPGTGSDQANAVAVSPDGKTVFVTGESTGTTSGYDYATIAYNAATGAQLWAKRYNGPSNSTDDATSLALSPTGSTVYVTGYSAGGTEDKDAYATIAYNAATGAQQWAQRYDAHGGSLDQAYSIAVGATGTVFVTGEAYAGVSTGYDYTTVAYNPAGAQLWVKHYSGPSSEADQADAVTVSPDGNTVFVTGEIYTGTSGYIYGTVAYNATTGAQLWAKHYTSGAGTDEAKSVAVSPDGKTVYVTGSIGDGLTGYATIAYNAATGAQVWVKHYHGTYPGFNEAYSVAVSPDGSTVYVTGYSAGNGTVDFVYATVAYDAATGAQLWVNRYRGSRGGQAYSVAVGPTGTVFVTGISGGFGTIAYSG